MIPETTKEKAFELWLAGNGYTQVTTKMNISQGSLTKILETKRALIPGLDKLRKNNVLVLRLAEEKGEDFVDAAKRLLSLEMETGTNCEELMKDFEGLSIKIVAEQKNLNKLRVEHRDLNKEILKIKDTFSSQNLTWNEALGILKNIKSLQDAFELWTNSLDAEIFDVEEKEKELVDLEKKEKRLQTSINRLTIENVDLHNKQRFYSRWMQEEAPKIWQLQADLEKYIKELQTRLEQLQEELGATEEQYELLQQQIKQLKKMKKDLKTFYADLEKKCKKMIDNATKKGKSIDTAILKKIKSANKQAEEIMQNAEATRAHKLSGIRAEEERIRKKVDAFKAEEQLFKIARSKGFQATPETKTEKKEQDKESRRKTPTTRWEKFLQEN